MKKVIVHSSAIGQALPNDVPQLIDVGLAAYGEYADIIGEEHWALMRQNLSDEAKIVHLLAQSTCFVARYNGKIIAMAFMLPSGNPVDVYEANWSSIRFVAVHPLHKGKQLAKNLTQMCINEAINSGEQTIALHTSSMMPAAMHIYESFGFKKIRDLGLRFGQPYFLYTLDLSAKTLAP